MSATEKTRAASGISSPGEPVRVARAVPALVVVAHHELALAEEVDVAQDLRADHWMLSDQRVLLFRELTRLEQDGIRYGDLADVVQEEAEFDLRRFLERDADPAREFHSVGGDTLSMFAGIRVARLDCVRKCANGCPIGPAQLLRAGALLLEDFSEVGGVALQLTLARRSLLLRAFEPCPKQGNSVLTGTGAQVLTIGARQRST